MAAVSQEPMQGRRGSADRIWKIKVRDGDAANRRRRWLFAGLAIVLMLAFLAWLIWLSMAGPSDVSLHDIYSP